MSEKQEPVKMQDLDQPAETLTDEQAEDTKGGVLIGLLLPAATPTRVASSNTDPANAGEVPQDQVSLNFTKVNTR